MRSEGQSASRTGATGGREWSQSRLCIEDSIHSLYGLYTVSMGAWEGAVRAGCALGWGKEKGEASSSLEGDSAHTHTSLPAQPCAVGLRRERAQPKGATVCLMERGTQYSQGAELALMGKWEVGAIPGPERKGEGHGRTCTRKSKLRGGHQGRYQQRSTPLEVGVQPGLSCRRSWLLCLLQEAQCLCDSLCVFAWIDVLPD